MRYKKALLSEQCKEIEENNRMGKTRDLTKKIGDTKGLFHANTGTIKDRNSKDLTEAEEIMKRWQEYTEEVDRKVPVCVCLVISRHQSWLTLCNPMDCSPPGSSVHGIFQARIVEWVTMPSCRVPSQPGDQTQVSCTAGGFFTVWATRRKVLPDLDDHDGVWSLT